MAFGGIRARPTIPQERQRPGFLLGRAIHGVGDDEHAGCKSTCCIIVDGDEAVLKLVDFFKIVIDANHAMAHFGKTGACDQLDIT